MWENILVAFQDMKRSSKQEDIEWRCTSYVAVKMGKWI
jgi:hypothetical protein